MRKYLLEEETCRKVLQSRKSDIIFVKRSEVRGLSQAKEGGIQDNLLKFMPKNWHQF